MCTSDQIAARNAAYDFAAVSSGAFIAGGVLLAAGVTLFVLAPSRKTEKAAVHSVSVAAGPLGVTVSGGF